MFNNSSHIDASYSTFSEVHRDQYYNVQSTVQGNQTINTIVHGNQILQDPAGSNFIEVLQKASAPSAAYNSAQRYPAPKCIEGTRTELLAHITSWVDKPDGVPICWLNGRPGSGKSAVSQTIAEKYADEKRLAASFFFSRRDLERRTTQHVVPTLTIQLLSFLPSIRPAVIAAMENDYMIPSKVLREQMEKLLLEPLSTATERPDRPLLVVIDALDECDDESLVSELVTLLALVPRRTELPLRLLITSRPEPWLDSRFHRPEISSLTLPLDIQTFSVEADIRTFLRHALDDIYDEHPQVMKAVTRPWPSSDDLEYMVGKAGGLFIFALTVAKFVGDKMYNPVERLQAILEDKAAVSIGSAYSDLDSLYRDAISVFPDPDVTRLILGVVYCMAVPLSVSGLHKLLQRPDVDPRIIVPALGSVLLASEDGKQPIQFYHASFRDFVINPQRSQKYAINPNAYHRLMAQLCFETMSDSLKRDMCGIGDTSKANNDIPDLVQRRQAAFDEALLYACRFWSRHLAQLSGDGIANEALLNGLKRFSTTVLLHWIETLSLFGELENAVVMLREGICWVKSLREIPKDSLALLEDAERLVVLYMDCISQCALHVYLTALLFSPPNSAIHKTFQHQSLGTLILPPDRSKDWMPLRKSINLHTPIHSVVFSPNSDLIATAGEKQGVRLWNAITGENTASFGDRSSTSLLVRFAPSGAFLAAAFEGGTIAVWDPKVGREHLKYDSCHTEPITCIEFSPSSTLLASASRDHTIRVWSIETAQPLYQLATHEGAVTSLVFSSDSRRLVSGAEDNLVIIWDMEMGKVVRGMMGHRKPVNCVALSKDGRMLASGSEDKTVKIWDTYTGKCSETLSKNHHTGIRNIHFFDDDKHLATVCDGEILSWNIGSHNKPDTIWIAEEFVKKTMKHVPAWHFKVLGWGAPRHVVRYFINKSIFEPSERKTTSCFATGSSSFAFTYAGCLHTGSLPDPVNGIPVAVAGAANDISPDGNWAVNGDAIGTLQILDLRVPKRTWDEIEAAAKLNPLRATDKLIPSPDGTRFVVYNLLQWYLVDDGQHIVNRIDLGLMASMRDSDKFRFKFSADGHVFCGAVPNLLDSDKSTLRVFDAATGELRAQFSGLKKIHSFVVSADGAWVACCHGSGVVDVFEVVGGGRTCMHMDADTLVQVLVFSDDTQSQSLVGGCETGTVHVWDRADGACTGTFGVSTSAVTALAYDTAASSGARVVIGRQDGSICVWSPSTSTSHDVVHGDQATVKHVDFVRFSDDRSRLTSRGEDGTVFTWAVSFEEQDIARCTLCSQEEADSAGVALPHLLSQTDPEDAVDSLFHTEYLVRKDGWLVKGERRLIWIPPSTRPRGKDALYAYESGLMAFWTPSTALIFIKWVDE